MVHGLKIKMTTDQAFYIAVCIITAATGVIIRAAVNRNRSAKGARIAIAFGDTFIILGVVGVIVLSC